MDSLNYSYKPGTNQLDHVLPNNYLCDAIGNLTRDSSEGIDYYLAEVITATDYYPFGMPMPGRQYSADYRFGFNGQEKDDEIEGDGSLNTAMFWEYDTRLGRRWNVDTKPKVDISNYSAFGDNPILYDDLNGDEPNNDGVKTENTTMDNVLVNEKEPESPNKPEKSVNTPESSSPNNDKSAEATQWYNSGKTITEGVKNAMDNLKSGDHISGPAIADIINAPKGKGMDNLLQGVDKLVKNADGTFSVQLKDGKSSISGPIGAGVAGDLHIENNATLKIEIINKDKLILSANGIKLGWLPLPKITLEGSKGKVLGIPVQLYK